MDPLSLELEVEQVEDQEVVYTKEKLDINTSSSLVSHPDEATKQQETIHSDLSISISDVQSEGSSLNSSFDDEQVVTREDKEEISEVVRVPQVSTIIIQTQVESEVVTSSSSSRSSLETIAPSAGDSTRTKWKEVDSEYSPPIDIVELQDSYHIFAEVPGVNVKDISIDLSNKLFTLTGDKRDHPMLSRGTQEGVVVQEINKGRFKRVLELPENVDTNDVAVEYEGGILQFKIRKIEDNTGEKESATGEAQEESKSAEADAEANEGSEQPSAARHKRTTKGSKKRSSCAIQ